MVKTTKKNLKKAFTITELVIVIAVIAILAAVLIPTLSGVVSKANQSVAMQEANAEWINYYAEIAADNKYDENDVYYVVHYDVDTSTPDYYYTVTAGQFNTTSNEYSATYDWAYDDAEYTGTTSTGETLVKIYSANTAVRNLTLSVSAVENGTSYYLKVVYKAPDNIETTLWYSVTAISDTVITLVKTIAAPASAALGSETGSVSATVTYGTYTFTNYAIATN